MSAEVFISYSTKDKQIADAACHYLEAKAIRCWIAPRDISPGHEWANAVVDAISDCKVVVLIFSSSANSSTIVRKEVQLAVFKEAVIIPFRIENVLPEKAMELFISANHWLDAITPPVEGHLNRLAENVEHLLSGSSDVAVRHNPVREIELIASKWVESGYPYKMLEGINQQLRLLLDDPPEALNTKDSNTLIMLMMAALHFGANWGFWVEQNHGSTLAIRRLLLQLNIDYYRPRLRSLYALQSCQRENIEEVINELGNQISSGSKALIERYVYPRTVIEYLEKLKKGDDPDIGVKAAAVIREVDRYWEQASPSQGRGLPVL